MIYTDIHRCLAIDYFDEFGPKSTTQPEKPLNEKKLLHLFCICGLEIEIRCTMHPNNGF